MTASRRSKLAVLSAACGLVSIAGVWSPRLLVAGVIGIFFGIMAARCRDARQSTRVIGAFGILLSTSVVAGGSLWHGIQFRSEAPPGFTRVDFGRTFAVSRSIPDGVGELVGRQICLKGYAYSGDDEPITTFILSPDGACSVGQIVGVVLREGDSWRWHRGPIAVSGTLSLNPDYSSDQIDVRYLLTDATVRDSQTPLGVLRGPLGSCFARRLPPSVEECPNEG